MSAALAAALLFGAPGPQPPVTLPDLCERLAPAVVQVVGAGGIRGIPSRASGVVLTREGHILTFDSIALVPDRTRVGLPGGIELPAAILARDPERCLALLKVEPPAPLRPVCLAPSGERPGPGRLALLLAHPFGITGPGEAPAAFFGLIKARLRLDLRLKLTSFPLKEEVLLTDAPANPGAQGGGLFDLQGRLIGLAGRVVEAAETNTLVHYSLPIDILRPFLDHALHGLSPAPKEAALPRRPPYLGLVLAEFSLRGSPPAYVERVEPGSPAASAGLRPDDLIMELAGQPARSCAEFRQIANKLEPGQAVEVLFRRGARLLSARIIPRSAP